MLSKFKAIRVLRHSPPRTGNGLLGLFCNPSCQMIEYGNSIDASPKAHESPELPPWVKFCNNENLSPAGSRNDFVFPSVADLVENQELQDLGRVKLVTSIPTVTTGSDVDRISTLLKNRFPSPDVVAQALNGCSVNVSEALVEQLMKRFSNDWISSLGVFNWATAQTCYAHSSNSYNVMIEILGKRKQFDLMWKLVEEMEIAGHSISSVTMTNIIRRLARANMWTDAIDTFRNAEQFGITKDITLMNVLMDSLANQLGVELAEEVFSEFKNQIAPDIRTFSILINGWCKIRKLSKAWNVLKRMEKYGFKPNVVCYTSIIQAHCRDWEFQEVFTILDDMLEKGCPPTAVTYTILIQFLGKAKQTSKALKVFYLLKQKGCKPDAPLYNTIISILGVAGKLDDARKVFEEMKSRGVLPDVNTYNAMITGCCLHSKGETALKLFREMEAVSCRPDLHTYAPLLKMCCRPKRLKMLYFLLGHMVKNDVSIELSTYTLLVNGFCKSGMLEHACLFFEESILKGWIPGNPTYMQLLTELDKNKMVKATDLLEKLMLRAENKLPSPPIQDCLVK